MKHARALRAIAIATTLTLAACGSDGSVDTAASDPSSPTVATSSDAATSAGDHNEADVMFAQSMIPHHAQAVEMSDIVLAKDGVDERVLAIAQQVKDAQGPEITQMQGWLEGWGAEMPDMSGGMMGEDGGMDHSTNGMMSMQDMQSLQDADGAQASRLFLEQMTAHHQGAIMMAQAEVENGQAADAVALAEMIVSTQQDEIAEMTGILETL